MLPPKAIGGRLHSVETQRKAKAEVPVPLPQPPTLSEMSGLQPINAASLRYALRPAPRYFGNRQVLGRIIGVGK